MQGARGDQVSASFSFESNRGFRLWCFAGVGNCAAGHENITAIECVYSVGNAIAEGAAGHRDALTVFKFQKRGSAFLTLQGFVVEGAAGNRAVLAIDQANTGPCFFGVAAEVVAADGHQS